MEGYVKLKNGETASVATIDRTMSSLRSLWYGKVEGKTYEKGKTVVLDLYNKANDNSHVLNQDHKEILKTLGLINGEKICLDVKNIVLSAIEIKDGKIFRINSPISISPSPSEHSNRKHL
jgi:hypothetical protein